MIAYNCLENGRRGTKLWVLKFNETNSILIIIPIFKDKPNEVNQKRKTLVVNALFNASGILETLWLILGREAAAAIDVPITQDKFLT